jgi:hypothetical protein
MQVLAEVRLAEARVRECLLDGLDAGPALSSCGNGLWSHQQWSFQRSQYGRCRHGVTDSAHVRVEVTSDRHAGAVQVWRATWVHRVCGR